MAKVIITKDLKEKIYKKFKHESVKVLNLLYSLKDNPKKGKKLAQIQGILIKEIKYKSFRFYFIVDGYKLKILDDENLANLLIKILAMSNKKNQQETIEKIKDFLRNFSKEILK
ncbi:MAG: hypothetical protein ACOCUU_02255 [Nanoarchaeota archaeon]